jgi:hypothetical protein
MRKAHAGSGEAVEILGRATVETANEAAISARIRAISDSLQ